MSLPRLYPLQFQPLLRRYVWGGRRLGTLLGKPIGDGDDYAESWEIVDRGVDQSVVTAGPLKGMSLAELMATRSVELLGKHHSCARFPLLFKFLDANRILSVQVHPNDGQAAKMQPPDLGKTEAWVIVHAEPGSVIYAGLKRGFDRAAFERELHRGTAELCLNRIEPAVGDCIFIPAGVVHALGAGLVVAEIQQSSDLTFRLFDWNRVGADGQPRALHIEQGLAAINFHQEPVTVQSPRSTSVPFVERLVTCDKFVLDRWRWQGTGSIRGDNRFHILVALEGSVAVLAGASRIRLSAGQTLLLPADLGAIDLLAEVRSTLLDIYLP